MARIVLWAIITGLLFLALLFFVFSRTRTTLPRRAVFSPLEERQTEETDSGIVYRSPVYDSVSRTDQLGTLIENMKTVGESPNNTLVSSTLLLNDRLLPLQGVGDNFATRKGENFRYLNINNSQEVNGEVVSDGEGNLFYRIRLS